MGNPYPVYSRFDVVKGNTMPHEEVRYQTMSKERTTYVAAWFGPYIICAIPSGSLVVAFLGVATSLGQHPAALVFSAIVIALSIPFAVVGAFRFAWWIEDMYNDKAYKSQNYLKSCVSVAKVLARLVDSSEDNAQIKRLAQDIYKYGTLLINKATNLRMIAKACSDQQTKDRLLNMANERTETACNIASKFQRMIPAIVAGSCSTGMVELEADLEAVKTTIERVNNEVKCHSTRD